MRNEAISASQLPDKSVMERIVNSANSQNERQQVIESRLGVLLEQLRGGGASCGGSCQPKPEPCGALHLLDEAVDRHCDLNSTILDQVAELESLLAF